MEASYYKKMEPFWDVWYIKKLLGEGSYGKVFEIERDDFGTKYKAALKVMTIPENPSEIDTLKSEGMDDKSITAYYHDFVKEIVKEFELMAKLKGNSNIVSYEDHKIVEHEDGLGWDIFIRMELLTPLTTYVQSRQITEQDVIHLGIDMCKALELCKGQNIIHRDIKPDNIFISANGDYKLGDFGVARTLEQTTSGLSKKGTYNYMAPEVYSNRPYNSTVDIYSLGIVLFRMCNGNRSPFILANQEKLTFNDKEVALTRRMNGEPLPEPAYSSPGLTQVIHKACAFNPSDRFQNATEMRLALEAVIASGGALIWNAETIKTDSSVSYDSSNKSVHDARQTKSTGKNKSTIVTAIIVLIVLLALLIGIAGVIFVIKNNSDKEDETSVRTNNHSRVIEDDEDSEEESQPEVSLEDETVTYMYVAQDSLNVRREASRDSEKIDVVDVGTQVAIISEVTGEDGTQWCNIRYNDEDGTVRFGFVQKLFLSETAYEDSEVTLSPGETYEYEDSKFMYVGCGSGVSSVAVRVYPASDAQVDFWADKGQELVASKETMDSDGNIWCYIYYTSSSGTPRYGYILKEYLTEYEVESGAILEDLAVGDIVELGSIEQDNNYDNGLEPIEWDVISASGGKAVLISHKILYSMEFDSSTGETTWEDSDIRAWLNGDFYNNSFNETEKNRIITVTNENPGNCYYTSDGDDYSYGSNDTQDNVYLLSVEDLLKYYDFGLWNDAKKYGYCMDLAASPTDYALSTGSTVEYFSHNFLTNNDMDEDLTTYGYTDDIVNVPLAKWALRTPGDWTDSYCLVTEYGFVSEGSAYWRNVSECGIRPVITVRYTESFSFDEAEEGE